MPVNSKWRSFFKENLLTILTIVGVFGGTCIGLIMKECTSPWSQREIMYISYPGELFLRMLKCLIVPLLVSSITSAIGSLDLSMSGKIATRSIVYYVTTTVSAVILGIILVSTVRPGVVSQIDAADAVKSSNSSKPMTRQVLTADTLLDLIRNLFPPNIIEATIYQDRTKLVPHDPPNDTLPLNQWKITPDSSKGTNVLGIVMFSVVFGATIGKMRAKGKPLLDFFVSLSEAMMIITSWVIWLSPVGVFFLVLSKVLEIVSFTEMVGQLGMYFITVMLGLLIHGLGTIPLLFFLVVRRLPYRDISKMGQVLATAFGTGSSSATMPITIQSLDNMGLDPRVTRFVIPVGATINMDGTALYEAVAALFIAQLRGISLSFGHIVAVSVTATAASIGAAGIPQAGLVTMVMVLDTVGLPAEDVTIIIAVDWLLDRFRTTINVMCDSIGAILVNHLSRGDLRSDFDNGDPHELQELKSGSNDKD
ncbi:excitatory amino acid transporter 1 [Bradysia coprophila]|uniref:excitatory amino acid transporter 1 n=1 Tax=Bradysia coprophila TaxID=38358 RepID=UPI00187DD616|nr:excitatory amino acid transporter 1 [Bradysia coprophila]XP_037024505.1 excitatory amino acid transporter 1 [Bradysia coprophila]